MNVNKIYKAVAEDDMNSPLPIIVLELEKQGYKVKIEGVEVSSKEFDDELFSDFEESVTEFNFEVKKNDEPAMKFKLIYTGYHEFTILKV